MYTGPLRGEVVFDQPLQEGHGYFLNWLFVQGTRKYIYPSPHMLGNKVVGALTLHGYKTGPPSVTYYAVPQDVKSLTGIPAEPFADFPLS